MNAGCLPKSHSLVTTTRHDGFLTKRTLDICTQKKGGRSVGYPCGLVGLRVPSLCDDKAVKSPPSGSSLRGPPLGSCSLPGSYNLWDLSFRISRTEARPTMVSEPLWLRRATEELSPRMASISERGIPRKSLSGGLGRVGIHERFNSRWPPS